MSTLKRDHVKRKVLRLSPRVGTQGRAVRFWWGVVAGSWFLSQSHLVERFLIWPLIFSSPRSSIRCTRHCKKPSRPWSPKRPYVGTKGHQSAVEEGTSAIKLTYPTWRNKTTIDSKVPFMVGHMFVLRGVHDLSNTSSAKLFGILCWEALCFLVWTIWWSWALLPPVSWPFARNKQHVPGKYPEQNWLMIEYLSFLREFFNKSTQQN